MTPEGLIRISSLLLLILMEGNGQPAIFPGKFSGLAIVDRRGPGGRDLDAPVG